MCVCVCVWVRACIYACVCIICHRKISLHSSVMNSENTTRTPPLSFLSWTPLCPLRRTINSATVVRGAGGGFTHPTVRMRQSQTDHALIIGQLRSNFHDDSAAVGVALKRIPFYINWPMETYPRSTLINFMDGFVTRADLIFTLKSPSDPIS